ncbi:MAG: FG-GAP-like repeat-containing protein, partial [Planctomycetota bacterium]
GDGRTDILLRVHDLPPGGEQPLFLGGGLDFTRATNFDSGTFIAAGGAFADIDGDGDPDLLLTSAGSAGGGSTFGEAKLYLNVSL